MIRTINDAIDPLKKAYQLLKKNDPLILSSATAFFTTFSLSPILIILTDILNPLLGRETVHRELFSKIQQMLGSVTARDVRTIVDGFETLESNIPFTLLTTVFFYFIATTLLSVIKHAIHQLWSFKEKEKNTAFYFLRERLTGIAMIFLFALLLVVSYSTDLLESTYSKQTFLVAFTNILFSISLIAAWFTLMFKFLPEAKVPWVIAIIGGVFTGIFFKVGIFLLSRILVHKQVALIFGVSSSMAMLLLFIFYCSFILYLGVAFMYELAESLKKPILPGKYAIAYREQITRK